MADNTKNAGGGFSGIVTIGTVVSLFNNSFVAEAGFFKGMFAHLLVGAGTGLGAAAFACVGVAALGGAGAVLGAGSKNVESGFVIGAVIGALGGGCWGAVEGYSATAQMLDHSMSQFKSSALETAKPDSAPVRVTVENGKAIAYLTPKVA